MVDERDVVQAARPAFGRPSEGAECIHSLLVVRERGGHVSHGVMNAADVLQDHGRLKGRAALIGEQVVCFAEPGQRVIVMPAGEIDAGEVVERASGLLPPACRPQLAPDIPGLLS